MVQNVETMNRITSDQCTFIGCVWGRKNPRVDVLAGRSLLVVCMFSKGTVHAATTLQLVNCASFARNNLKGEHATSCNLDFVFGHVSAMKIVLFSLNIAVEHALLNTASTGPHFQHGQPGTTSPVPFTLEDPICKNHRKVEVHHWCVFGNINT